MTLLVDSINTIHFFHSNLKEHLQLLPILYNQLHNNCAPLMKYLYSQCVFYSIRTIVTILLLMKILRILRVFTICRAFKYSSHAFASIYSDTKEYEVKELERRERAVTNPFSQTFTCWILLWIIIIVFPLFDDS